MKLEQKYLGQLLKQMRARWEPLGAVIFKHADGFTTGVPDVSITLHKTLWVEAKVYEGKIIDTHLQRLRMKQLHNARYVVWDVTTTPKMTYVIHPAAVPMEGQWEWPMHGMADNTALLVSSARGISHQFVLDALSVHYPGVHV